MGEPFVGEIRMFAGSFPPAGWAFCDGTPLPISENDQLFQLIGTTYGGDGETTFNLPNLASRIPVHMGQGPGLSNNYQLGETFGSENVTLTIQQIPSHTHAVVVSGDVANSTTASNNLPATTNQLKIYTEASPTKNFSANALTPTGGSQPHENMMPFTVVSFIISLFGIYPQQF